MKREVKITKDGSTTFYVPELGEHYNSHFGAIQESSHIFIDSALKQIDKEEINILEFGLGTALNALQTYNYAKENCLRINYCGVEKYPLLEDEYSQLNYPNNAILSEIHNAEWDKEFRIDDNFKIIKLKSDFVDLILNENNYDVVFFDAFAPDVQPHLWTLQIFQKIYKAMKIGGVLTTYTVKGSVRRIMKEAGFQVEKIPGPPGKREISRAWKRRV